jgi:hypothetical protein
VATVTARARAPAMACVGGLGRLGRTSAGDSLRCSAARGAVASKPLLGPWKVLRATRRLRECRKREFSTRMRSPLHWGGADASGRPCPTPGGPSGAVVGVLLRNYGFTDLPPSLPLPRSDPVTRISESSYRRSLTYSFESAFFIIHVCTCLTCMFLEVEWGGRAQGVSVNVASQ